MVSEKPVVKSSVTPEEDVKAVMESVVQISVDGVSDIVLDGCSEDRELESEVVPSDVSVDIKVVSNEEDATSVEVVHSGVEISVGKVSVIVVEGGSVDEIEDVSVKVSDVKSVEIEDVKETASVVESEVEISVEGSVMVLEESVSETEVDEISVLILDGGSEEE